MFEDKEILNIILYEKRFTTYAVCLVMFVAGILLGLVKVPDSAVLEAYRAKCVPYTYCDDAAGIKDFELMEKDGVYYIKCVSSKNIAGVYFEDKYFKFKPSSDFSKVDVPCNGKITGYVVAGDTK